MNTVGASLLAIDFALHTIAGRPAPTDSNQESDI